MTDTYAIADIHGYRADLRRILQQQGLVDARAAWTGGTATLWLLGDYVDRGPDGVGVVDDVRSLMEQAPAHGGRVLPLLGNHELQLLAAHRFGETPVPELGHHLNWLNGWRDFGGRDEDLERLTPDRVEWIASLPAMALAGGHLLVHSDTDLYLELGDSIVEVNARGSQILSRSNLDEWVSLATVLSSRGRLRTDSAVESMLATFGGDDIVHGHSNLVSHFGYAPDAIAGPHVYADGRVLAIDGGRYEGGRLLLVPLDV